jgi:hypothetical protein
VEPTPSQWRHSHNHSAVVPPPHLLRPHRKASFDALQEAVHALARAQGAADAPVPTIVLKPATTDHDADPLKAACTMFGGVPEAFHPTLAEHIRLGGELAKGTTIAPDSAEAVAQQIGDAVREGVRKSGGTEEQVEASTNPVPRPRPH